MRVLWISAIVLCVDQLSKAAVLVFMRRGESIALVGDWLRFTFTENPGMAFGITVGARGFVTVVSIIVTILVLGYLYSVRTGYLPYLVSLAFVLGGAVGNIIDRVFYAVILGYGGLFMGKVVDFIHVNIWHGYIPEAIPLIGGNYTSLFPIWNVADMAIVVGVVGILVFQRGFHRRAARDQVVQKEAGRTPAVGGDLGEMAPAGTTTHGAVPPQAPTAENTGPSREAAARESQVQSSTSEDRSSPYAPPSGGEAPSGSSERRA